MSTGRGAEEGNLGERIARFACHFDPGTIPAEAFRQARRAFVDTIGVMLAGSRLKAAAIACDMVRGEGAREVVLTVGQSLRTSSQLAAFANGVAAHGMDYDFSHLMGQPAAPIIPALLPVAEEAGASAGELLAAFVVGFEIASRLCRVNPSLVTVAGFHVTSAVGPIAAAAAVARLRRLPADAVANAVGIAASTAGGLPVNYGTMTKPFHAGHAARSAVTAATLAAAGLTASPVALEGRAGYLAAFARGLPVHAEVFDDLGAEYDLVRYGFAVKPYPCGGLAHPVIDAALELRAALGQRVADVAAVEVGLTPLAARAIKTSYPKSEEEAKFSAPFIVAYTLLRGAPLIDAFSEAAIHDPEVRRLAATISASVDPALGAPDVSPFPARLTLTLGDGTRMERLRDHATGSPARPMSAVQLREKFLDCAMRVVDEEPANAIYAELSGLPGEAALDRLWTLLSG